MQIQTVRWPEGQGRPAHLDGVGPYQADLTIAPEKFQAWVSRIVVQEDGSVIAPGGGDRDKRIGYLSKGPRGNTTLEAVLREWARNSNLIIVEAPAPEPAPAPKRKKKDEE